MWEEKVANGEKLNCSENKKKCESCWILLATFSSCNFYFTRQFLYLKYLKYVKFDGDVHLFCKFCTKTHFEFWRYLINPIQHGPFWDCSRIGGGFQKEPSSLKSVTYTLQLWNLAQFKTLPIEVSKLYLPI